MSGSESRRAGPHPCSTQSSSSADAAPTCKPQSGQQVCSKRLRLLGALTVTDDIVHIPLERDVRVGPRHPPVERIVQKQVCQQGTDDPTLWRSCLAWDDAAILHLHRRLQPAIDVEQHPWAVRMMADRFEQQLPVDTVEVAFYVDVEHPIVTPAALTRRAHRIDRRSVGSVAIGVGVEHRLETRLQITTSDLLGDTVCNRRYSQRAHAAVRLWNFHSPYRRRKVAP